MGIWLVLPILPYQAVIAGTPPSCGRHGELRLCVCGIADPPAAARSPDDRRGLPARGRSGRPCHVGRELGAGGMAIVDRLIARDTVEERVLELQQKKRHLADAILTADNSVISRSAAGGPGTASLVRDSIERFSVVVRQWNLGAL